MSDRNSIVSDYFEKILNTIDVGVHFIDQEGNTVFYNDKMAEIDGLDREQVLGKNILHLYPSLTQETSTLEKVLQTGQQLPAHIQTYFNVTGKRIMTINSTYPLYDNGQLIGALEVAKDITSIVQLHDQILDLRHQLYQAKQKENKHKGTARYEFSDLIGRSKAFQDALTLAKKTSRTVSPVMICGPTGTGKELFAQSIHNAGARRNRPFVAQNCAAVPADLLEGIMFGTARGAFTGAVDRAGLFEQASGGTLFLDELSSLDVYLQAKLLRVLQDGMVRRIGGTHEQQADVRIITAMNMDPAQALEEGLLRYDLFYRLSVVKIELPPLQQREADIPLLVNHFIEKLNPVFGLHIRNLSPDALRRLTAYSWPGNVRELGHAIESAYNMVEIDEETIEERHLPRGLLVDREAAAEVDSGSGNDRLPERMKQLEREAIALAFQKNGYNVSQTANELGMKRQALQYKLNRYGITKKP
ncbi:sigma-54-dependent Fis family transcriptional regulator [Paenibacillus sp. CF384]|uniref:sigma-54 interaction domain-containing protein n=1 Tax=Paenibacillus sp. CF384 TaxID=1884382 RepID=UPI00089B5DEE|nr:sigma 54-interacting transcriptional regulator [Paenibacillus sp. CF384]SDW18696.1 arginine utilization regulatory protein [Paenibacillus sp. CF384]